MPTAHCHLHCCAPHRDASLRPPAGLPELEATFQEPDTHYPLSITLPMVFMVLLNLGLFAWAGLLSFRAWRWAFGLLGPLQPAGLAAAAAYLALSVWLYSRPVNALQMHAQQGRPGSLAQSAADLQALNGAARKER